MKYRPILSHTYYLIKGSAANGKAQASWNEHFKFVDSIQVKKLSDPGIEHLSDYDVDTLIEIATQYKDMEEEDLSELTHTFDENKRHRDGTHKSEPIPEIDLLRGIGYTQEQGNMLLEETAAYAIEQEVLGCR